MKYSWKLKFSSENIRQLRSITIKEYQFDFKLWPKSFHESKKWGFDILLELVNYYKNYNFRTEERAKDVFLIGRSSARELRVESLSWLRVESLYNVHVDMMQEDESDIDRMLIL